MKVAFIGLGSMGAPQAKLIARAGFDLAVYDPTTAALDAFEGVARLAGSPAQAGEGADIACLCVRDDEQVRAALFGTRGLVEALRPGALVVIHSTIAVTALQDIGQQLTARGIALIDAPVSRTRPSDDEPFVFTMIGGDAANIGRAMPVIESFSTDIDHVGPLGAGLATKIANNLVTWTQIIVGKQAAGLALRHGVPVERLLGVMEANGNLTPTMAALLHGHASAARDTPERRAFMASQTGIGEKDLALAIEAAAQCGISTDMMVAAHAAVRDAMTTAL